MALLARLRQPYQLATAAGGCFALAGLSDSQRDAQYISPNMAAALFLFSAVQLRVGWRNSQKWLLATNTCNAAVQAYNLRRHWKAKSQWTVSDRDAPPADSDGRARVRVVVLGSGWGAMSFLRSLSPSLAQGDAPFDVTLVSPRNYFLYTPLLAATASGSVEARSVVDPVRSHITDKGNYYEAECTDIDPERKVVTCRYPKAYRGAEGEKERVFQLSYDMLVVAVGSVVNTFGVPGVQENAFFLKTAEHARTLRQRVNEAFELASLPGTTAAERKKLLSFVVVGGGPTGVELAAELHDLVSDDMLRYFPKLSNDWAIRLVDTHDHILSMFDRQIATYATQQFRRNGIDLVLNCRVKAVEPDAVVVQLNGADVPSRVEYGTCIWTTGIAMHPLVQSLISKLPEAREHWKSLRCNPTLAVHGSGGTIYALGDAATVEQARVLQHAEELFKAGDSNSDGLLSCVEVMAVLKKAQKTYPQIAEFAHRMQCGPDAVDNMAQFMNQVLRAKSKVSYDNVIATADWISSDDDEESAAGDDGGQTDSTPAAGSMLTLQQFSQQLAAIDNSLRSLPATAQVAHQQGEYLARLFQNHVGRTPDSSRIGVPSDAPSFHYVHLGSLAYIGADKAVMELPYKNTPVSAFKGWLMGFAWKGAETFMQTSVKNMYLVSRDLMKTKVFGRDVSDV
ncbi:hypothetical protein WJX72_011813 [[Myrmecia] bisecta]|uniref:NADH:ubiquinone reductase (non-electrogenic) n=1 Tax=[Myrmecia] bisecta TaxID=41462 RepID=A0AAW1QA65_9CHLO